MTNKEAIKIIQDCKEKSFKRMYYTLDEYHEAVDMAIKALEQEPICPSHGIDCEDCPAYDPCGDAISRQAAKGLLEDRFMELQKRHDDKRYETNYCLNTILELPPVKPQPIERLERAESEEQG